MKTLTLETSRFMLKPVDADSGPYFMDLDSDTEVMRYLTNGVPSTQEQVDAAVKRITALFELHQGAFGVWLAFEKVSGELVGWVLFRPDKKDPSNTDRIEVGYRLKKKFWGQGIATELAQHMIDYGFNTLGVSEIFAVTTLHNIGSQSVMKKLGMSFLKQYLDDEISWDDKRAVLYSLNSPSKVAP